MNAIGILGGTFDPIHYGHLRLAEEALHALALDHVRFIPAAVPPHRGSPRASIDRRIAMAQLAVEHNSAFVIDAREARREGRSYTIDTLADMRREMQDASFYLLVGADAFLGLPQWRRWRELFDFCHVIVAGRPDVSLARETMSAELKLEFETRFVDDARDLRAEKNGKVAALVMTALAISASHLRGLIAQGQSARYLLPDSVLDYIHTHRLYRTEADEA